MLLMKDIFIIFIKAVVFLRGKNCVCLSEMCFLQSANQLKEELDLIQKFVSEVSVA